MNLDAVLKIAAKVTGLEAIAGLGKGLAGVGKAADGTVKPLQGMGNAIAGIASFAGAVGLGFIARDLVQAGAEAQSADIRIQALAKGYGETTAVAAVAAKAASQFALGNVEAKNAVTDLYGRLRPMGVTLKEVETVFFGVNKAAKMVGLTTADTEGVMLQLSQALGSGKLQGDELRSIMERMPAVGQAVAKVMGVAASEIKELGSEGKITTEIMIQAAAELNKLQPPPPTALQEYEKAMKDLRTEFGENLLPLLTPFITGLTNLIKAFAALPEPLQTAIVLLGGIALVLGTVVPLLSTIVPVIASVAGAFVGLGATIAGWAGAIGPALASITALFAAWAPGIVAFFSGPVGWTVLAVAAVVAMAYAFREPLMEFVSWFGEVFKQGWEAAMAVAYQLFVEPWVKLWETTLRDPVTKAWDWIKGAFVAAGENFMNNVVNPIRDAWQGLMELLPNAMKSAADGVKSVWDGAMGAIKNAVNGAMSAVAGTINKVIGMINKVIDGVNAIHSKVGWSAIAKISTVSVPKFAQGGFVTGPTLAMVGDNPGGREYIVPEGKASAFANNIMAGRRGAAAIPSTTGSSAAPVAAPINITTGPVMEMDGTRYVKVEDLERAVQQTQRQIYATLRTPGGRRAIGLP